MLPIGASAKFPFQARSAGGQHFDEVIAAVAPAIRPCLSNRGSINRLLRIMVKTVFRRTPDRKKGGPFAFTWL